MLLRQFQLFLFLLLLTLFFIFIPTLSTATTGDGSGGSENKTKRRPKKKEQWTDEKYERWKHMCPLDIEPTSLVSSVIKESEFEVRCWLDKAEFLLNEYNGEGWNPLLWAAASNQVRIAEILLKSGANVNIQNEAGDTPLVLSVYMGNAGMLKLLLSYKADPEPKSKLASSSPLARAAMNGHVSCVQMLLEANINVNSKNSLGRTPLMHATLGGYKTIVSLLLKKGAFVNMQDNNKFSALMIAASKGYEEIVKILITKGANLDLQDHQGYTALIWAVVEGHHNISKALLEDCFDDTIVSKRVCANHRLRDTNKRNALFYAVKYSNTVLGPILTELNQLDIHRENSGL